MPYNLRNVFERHRDRKWHLLRGLGNWGDELLFAGAEVLADRVGLDWTSYSTPEFESAKTSPKDCIYLQGGGGFNCWSSGRAFVNLKLALERPAFAVVQGPVSLGGNFEWLKRTIDDSMASMNCDEFWFFARENRTLGTLAKIGVQDAGAMLQIDQDTALSLTAADLADIAQMDSIPGGNYDLIVKREDPEQPRNMPRQKAAYMSPRGITIDPAYEAISFRHWVRIHLYAKSITTNRLHSSIIGCVAGKPVTLGPGSYHKNRTVWEYSLSGANVVWTDSFDAAPARIWNNLPEWFRNSYKVRRLRLACYRVPLS